MADEMETDLSRALREKVWYGRSSMQKWIWENYEQIVEAMPGPRRNWRVLTEAAIEAKTLDADKKKPNANSMRAAFNRVKRIKEAIGTTASPKPHPPDRKSSTSPTIRQETLTDDSPEDVTPRDNFRPAKLR